MKVRITMESGKTMDAILYPECAPQSVANFCNLVKKGFYTGVQFHRVINNFMIQCGDPAFGGGVVGDNGTIVGEFTANGIANPLGHYRGVLSMARTNVFDSAGSQFFIVHQDSHFLDGQYAAFGMLVSGYDVLDEIASTQTAANDIPVAPKIIQSIEMLDE